MRIRFVSPYNVIIGNVTLFVLEENLLGATFLFPYNEVIGNIPVFMLEVNPTCIRFL